MNDLDLNRMRQRIVALTSRVPKLVAQGGHNLTVDFRLTSNSARKTLNNRRATQGELTHALHNMERFFDADELARI